MKIQVENMGALQQAEFELGDLTILCGGNNTGKTYATYALYGFLSGWREAISIPIPEETIRALLSDGVVHIDVAEYQKDAAVFLEKGCVAYTERLPTIFAASKERFRDSTFHIGIEPDELDISGKYERVVKAAENNIGLFSLTKEQDGAGLNIALLVDKEGIKIPHNVIMQVIGLALKKILFGSLFHETFIASAERTGAVIFRRELDFSRNRVVDKVDRFFGEIGKGGDKINPIKLLSTFVDKDEGYEGYALPVNENVDFTRKLEDISKKTSFISENHPEILSDFSDIVGGEYTVTQHDQLYFLPRGKRGVRLTMDESSSAVRSLLDIGFYLKHLAKPGDILMVDEPELNLHPENQRRVARLFARLVNIGIKIFITTHSDYIVKELNTLIMLNGGRSHLERIAREEGYLPEELLRPEQIRVYIAEEGLIKQEGKKRRSKGLTLTPADIDPELGIEVGSFDTTIDTMNRIQEEIVWGDE
uniref:AAA domain-containing protein, putative AbiEii toxin, Type IV TA system n=1 Tax=Candidatus Kentrum eta TaxID=2126337 RepID=A0A450V9I6_9GAMM|nr:MAG: AAA domain-containing protein, putative AbiEii toxin, Type IV TA system [Candidatus Kentron sp. H]VFJ94992.1 MAG: AAA domain-containing protein, putative AbiEii toxin, Type IV TA system [Candidatus Kentron sp. H]VFK01473.1 MAG: AAA domain-containing protein, putative AbiEii toxin, Type IV TA system [Candidatus Kentron sp. H]